MERQQLEDVWRGRLADAKLRLDFATTYLNEVKKDFKDATSDGHYAFERAVRAQNVALADYTRILRIFTDLVVHGKIPDGAQHNIDGHSPLCGFRAKAKRIPGRT